ncbi:hypothetical protein TSOC_008290, partial [Tetrabaena socialis]
SPGDVSLRGSYLHPPSGLGVFAVLPLAEHLSGQAPQVGVRYSSPQAAGGAIFAPQEGKLDRLWLASRLRSGFTLGLQLSPRLPLSDLLPPLTTGPADAPLAGAAGGGSAGAAGAGGLLGGMGLAEPAARLVAAAPWLRSRSSLLLAYSPAPSASSPGGSFTASVELAEGRSLACSFFQHVAATRQVVNPFEEDEVVGITNYLDIGLQLTTSLGHADDTGKPKADAPEQRQPPGKAEERKAERPATVNLAASWQINKNWLLKARVGSESAAAAVGVRAWHAVSAYLTASIAIDYATKRPRYGAELCVENFGPLRYERGADDVAAGRALLQRHEASPQDLANYAGRGVLGAQQLPLRAAPHGKYTALPAARRAAEQCTFGAAPQVRRASGSSGGGSGPSAGALEKERRRVAALL